MECEAFQEDLSARVDGELTRAEAGRLAAHLQSCRSCSELLQDFHDTSLLVRRLPVLRAPTFALDPTIDLVRATRQRASEPWLSHARRFLFEPLFPKVGIEAVSLAAIVVLAVLVGREKFMTNNGNGPETTGTWWHTAEAPPSSSTPITHLPAAGSEFGLPQFYDFRDLKSHGRRDVGTFNERERVAWEHGSWHQGRRFGRDGWWWEVNDAWYRYEQPASGPPLYVSEVRYTYPLPKIAPPSSLPALPPSAPYAPLSPLAPKP
jgi:hypothetical protein